MLKPSAFLQTVRRRLLTARERLVAACWQVDRSQPLSVERAVSQWTYRNFDEAKSESLQAVETYPHYWGRKFEQCWWRVTLPAQRPADSFLVWDDQAEATVYIDGQPWFGIDPGHRHCPLPDDVKELWIESTCCRTGVNVEGQPGGISDHGSIFEGAYLAQRDETAWQLRHDYDVLLDAAEQIYEKVTAGNTLSSVGFAPPPLTKAPPLLRQLLRGLEKAVDCWDAGDRQGMKQVLDELYEACPADAHDLDVVLTGHAHIDLVWCWPERVGVFKAIHSFANALHLMDRYPEFRFGYSQPASYRAVGEHCPQLLERVKERIAEGRWEATGALEVESDTQLSCGESLTRSVELGQAGFRELRGEPSTVAWLPDCFGFTGCLPQILRQFDVTSFFTTKLYWSDSVPFPHSSFRWAGLDGTEVIAHVGWDHYNQRLRPQELRHFADTHRQADVHRETLMPVGYGDGGGGTDAAMCERGRRLSNLAGVPRAKWGSIEEFFERLGQLRDQLPKYRGELYLQYHRGVQTTNGELKGSYRAAERAMQIWEAARCVSSGQPLEDKPWQRLVFTQFHDHITGTSIEEVYRKAIPELKGLAKQALDGAQEDLSGNTNGQPCVFNPCPVDRPWWDGERWCELPPLAGQPVESLKSLDAAEVKASETSLSSDRVTVDFDEQGEIARLQFDDCEVPLCEPAGRLWLFRDYPHQWDAWEVERGTLNHGIAQTQVLSRRVERDDAGRTVLAIERKLGDNSHAIMRYSLDGVRPLLHLDIELDWHESQTMLKYALPTGYQIAEARFGAPFGSTRRDQQPGELDVESRFESPASRWASISEENGQQGVALITESKYGFGCLDGLLHVSLLRSPMYRYADLQRDLRDLDDEGFYTDQGRQLIRLALAPAVSTAPRQEQPAMLADTLFTSAVTYTGGECSAGLLGLEGGESLIPSWARPMGDGRWILRLHETQGLRGEVTLNLREGMNITPVDLAGREVPAEGFKVSDNRVAFKPYQVISLLVSGVA